MRTRYIVKVVTDGKKGFCTNWYHFDTDKRAAEIFEELAAAAPLLNGNYYKDVQMIIIEEEA